MPCSSRCIEKGCCEVASESKLVCRYTCLVPSYMPPPSGRGPPQSPAVPSPPSSPGSVFSSFLSSSSLALSRHSCGGTLCMDGTSGPGRSGCQILHCFLLLGQWSCVMNAGVLPCMHACVLVPSFTNLSQSLTIAKECGGSRGERKWTRTTQPCFAPSLPHGHCTDIRL